MFLLPSCEKSELKTAPEEPIISRLSNEEKVCSLVQKAWNVVHATDIDIDEYLNSNFWTLAELTNPTQGQMDDMEDYLDVAAGLFLAEDLDLPDLFDNVLFLDLDQTEFEGLASECQLIEPRWCLVCNTRACGNSATAYGVSVMVGSPVGALLSNLGMWVHCNHN